MPPKASNVSCESVIPQIKNRQLLYEFHWVRQQFQNVK